MIASITTFAGVAVGSVANSPYLQMLERESAAMKKAISSARQALGAIT